MAKTNLLNLNREGLRNFFKEMGEKPFRADQVMKWIYQHGISDFEEMSNLNKNLRAMLIENCEIKAPEIAYFQEASDGTIKFALTLEGGQEVESVAHCLKRAQSLRRKIHALCRFARRSFRQAKPRFSRIA